VTRLEDRSQLRAQLTRHEGLRLKAYRDTVGKLTIGVGRNLDDVGITDHEAAYLLSGDIDRAVRGLFARYPAWFPKLDPVRQAVLVNMAFNLGLTGLAGFRRTLDCVARGQYGEASDAMLESKWADQVGQRAVELAAQMRTGAWQS
jgi:lysozyme